jgi:hypothetical protein
LVGDTGLPVAVSANNEPKTNNQDVSRDAAIDEDSSSFESKHQGPPSRTVGLT